MVFSITDIILLLHIKSAVDKTNYHNELLHSIRMESNQINPVEHQSYAP